MRHQGWAYRPDIDGLRALAVCAVLIVHAFPTALPGGFAGVDLFFVISGYLITGIVATAHDESRFSLAQIYAGRARRIFPSLALVLAATYGLGWFVMYAGEYQQLGKHIWAGAAFVSNWVSWREAGYFDRAAETKPLLHLWSLAIEEQFYLLWPVIVGFVLRRRRAAVPVVVGMFALSFGANVWIVGEHASAAFFLLPTRFWELLAGALLVFLPPAALLPGRRADQLSFLGLALCFASFAVLRPSFAFPGWWAGLPVLAACALIVAGADAWVNRTLLSHPVAVWTGRISYPLYLWHWPLLSMASIVAGALEVPAAVRLGLLGGTVVLAWMTTVGLEARFRHGPPRTMKIPVPCFALFAIGFTGYRLYEREGFNFRKGHDANADVATTSLGRGREFVDKECAVGDRKLVSYCFTDRQAVPRFAIWGDSKADALYWGLVRHSAPGEAWTLLGRSSCAPMSGVERSGVYNGDPPAACAEANRRILRALLANDTIRTVVLAFSDRDTIGPRFAWRRGNRGMALDDTALALEGLDGAVEALERAGKRVAVVLDNPRLPDPPRCMERAVLAWPGVRNALGLDKGPSSARVWEAEFATDSVGRLVMYYSSEEYKGSGYNQLIAERVSNDGGATWSADTIVVGVSDGNQQRPGMPLVARLPNGSYVMTYEVCGQSNCDAFIRASSDGVSWGVPSNLGTRIESTSGNHFSQTPTVRWYNDGSANGRLLVTGMVLRRNADNGVAVGNGQTFMYNTNNGTGQWTEGATPQAAATNGGSDVCNGYTTQLLPSANGAQLYELVNVGCSIKFATGPINNPVVSGIYTLISKNSGLALDVNGCSTAAGANVQQWTPNGANCQRWNMQNQGNGDYVLTSVNSGMALDVNACSTANGGNVQQWTPNGAACQAWRPEPVGDGYFRLVSKNSGLALDVDACSTAPGGNVQQWQWLGGDCQRWKLQPSP